MGRIAEIGPAVLEVLLGMSVVHIVAGVLALARGELYALAGLKVLAVMSANLLEL